MSRKHFQSLATALGLQLRYAADVSWETGQGFLLAVEAIERDLDAQSATFRRDTFHEWVMDTATGRRDAEGKLVKVSA
jgi:hypothetical protein